MDVERLAQSVEYRTVRSPLRICPLGAHVDHQGGLVTALALDRHIALYFRPREDGQVVLRSTHFEGVESFHVTDNVECDVSIWGAFVRGAVRSLARHHRIKIGIEGVVDATLPTGGLSSSAAVCTAYLTALAEVNGIRLEPLELVHYAHWVEREFIGLKNGILDHAANVLSKAGALLALDCSTQEHELIPRPGNMPTYTIMLVYSGVIKSLISTDYNNRVDECRAAAWFLREFAGAGKVQPFANTTLRSVDPKAYEEHRDKLPGRFRRRADHFFSEMRRVREGIEAWKAGDLVRFGQLMNESGLSSIQNYECGCPELISLYDILRQAPGVYGTRFSGAGFRGFCIALVDPSKAQEVEEIVRTEYPARHPQYADVMQVYFCDSADGVEIVS